MYFLERVRWFVYVMSYWQIFMQTRKLVPVKALEYEQKLV